MNTNTNANTNEAPNTEFLELTFVKETATGAGLNQQIQMENNGDGTFHVTDGRIGIKVGPKKPKQYNLPIEDWDKFYFSKISRGYLLTKTKKMETKEVEVGKHKPIPDKIVHELVERLMAYANQAMEENFTVKVEAISDEMIEYGKNVLADLSKNANKMSVAEFNGKLKVLYAAIPRRIDKLSNKLAKDKASFAEILDEEQEIFDLMLSQVKLATSGGSNQTILEELGIFIRPETEKEIEETKKLLKEQKDKYLRSWKVENAKTKKIFDKYIKKENLSEGKGVDFLWHGSKHQNWWSIITNGLLLNPDAVITGKAYGQGTYFAPDPIKSLGYTSRAGAKWTNGTMDTGFMGIYRVATGNRYNGHLGCDTTLNYKKLQQIQPGAHCTWAECRYSHFMMDEVIVYQECQSDIDRLVELAM